MNTQPHQAITTPPTTVIDSAELAHIAELLDLLDGFLRHDRTVTALLDGYLHATGRDRPQLPHGTSQDPGLIIDQISLTAYALRAHRRQ